MRDHLRFSVVYWHTFRGTGSDPFGPGYAVRPWEDGTDSVENAQNRVRVAFEFIEKLGAPFYCVPRPRRRPRRRRRSPRPTRTSTRSSRCSRKSSSGPASSCSGARPTCSATRATCTARRPAERRRLRLRRRPGEEGAGSDQGARRRGLHLLGRPRGLPEPWNTDMKRELDHLGPLPPHGGRLREGDRLHRPVLIEPKPKEPTKHQYDFDAAACLNFLRDYDLLDALQAEPRDQPRHARRPHDDARAGSTPATQGVLGSIDANTGDLLLGWDTDQFPTDIYLTTQCMLAILKYGRLHDRRRELRRQGPPRELRAGRPVPRPHRRHGRLRPRPEDRRRDPRRRPARGVRQGALRELGQRHRRARSRRARPSFATLEKYMLEKGDVDAERERPAGDAREPHQRVPLTRSGPSRTDPGGWTIEDRGRRQDAVTPGLAPARRGRRRSPA